MTCRQLGGPCATEHTGESADDIIHAQDQHLRKAVAAGDDDHVPAHGDMQGRWKRPVSGTTWYLGVTRDFRDRPDDGGPDAST